MVKQEASMRKYVLDCPLQCDPHRWRSVVLPARDVPEDLALLAQHCPHRPVALVHPLLGGASNVRGMPSDPVLHGLDGCLHLRRN